VLPGAHGAPHSTLQQWVAAQIEARAGDAPQPGAGAPLQRSGGGGGHDGGGGGRASDAEAAARAAQRRGQPRRGGGAAASPTGQAQQQQKQQKHHHQLTAGGLVIEDLEDEAGPSEGSGGAALDAGGPQAQADGPAPAQPPAPQPTLAARAASSGPPGGAELLPPGEARALWDALWGAGGVPPASGWQQGLFFAGAPPPGLEWGLVQASGGPCGLLAAVQGELLAHLLDARGGAGGGGKDASAPGLSCLDAAPPRPGELPEALAEAVTRMLWRAAGGESGGVGAPAAVIVTCTQATDCPAPVLAGALAARRAGSRAELRALAAAALAGQWGAPRGWGVVLLLASLTLSRGLAGVAADMDEPGTPLVGAHGHCNFELVALALTGRAVTNAFDGDRRLGSGGGGGAGGGGSGGDGGASDGGAAGAEDGGDAAALRGVAARSRVGLLSLHEW
jgi:hypothetical protein